MGLDVTGLGSVFDFGSKIIDKILPDVAQRDAAKLELIKQSQAGEFKELDARMSAIMAEAQSADPWTSRARPSFLYVVYLLLLWSIPMGALYAFRPDVAANFTTGFKDWLGAIPEPILALFGTVMTGYVLGRSYEKTKGVK